MNGIDLDQLDQLSEGLSLAFYILMFMALVTALAGSTRSALMLLILGSCAHVGRAGLSEFGARQRARRHRLKPVPRAAVGSGPERTARVRRAAV